MLSQEEDGNDKPVAYFSHQLHGAEVRFSTTELECLAVVEAAQHFLEINLLE